MVHRGPRGSGGIAAELDVPLHVDAYVHPGLAGGHARLPAVHHALHRRRARILPAPGEPRGGRTATGIRAAKNVGAALTRACPPPWVSSDQAVLVDLDANTVTTAAPVVRLPPTERAKLFQHLQQNVGTRLPPGTTVPSIFVAFPFNKCPPSTSVAARRHWQTVHEANTTCPQHVVVHRAPVTCVRSSPEGAAALAAPAMGSAAAAAKAKQPPALASFKRFVSDVAHRPRHKPGSSSPAPRAPADQGSGDAGVASENVCGARRDGTAGGFTRFTSIGWELAALCPPIQPPVASRDGLREATSSSVDVVCRRVGGWPCTCVVTSPPAFSRIATVVRDAQRAPSSDAADSAYFSQTAVQMGFLRVFVSLLRHYRDYLLVPDDTDWSLQQPSASAIDRDRFLASFDKDRRVRRRTTDGAIFRRALTGFCLRIAGTTPLAAVHGGLSGHDGVQFLRV